ncbi:MAG: hypothetical protein ABSF91_03045 [Bacteroidota bacterium]|jgi:hypothetical protein
MKTPKWTPAQPTQVLNFFIFYILAMIFWGMVYASSSNPIANWFSTIFRDGFVPLLIYSAGYALVVQYINKRKKATDKHSTPSHSL